MPTELRASTKTLEFHTDALVLDALTLDYVLDEPYVERVRKGGVNAAIVTLAVEEDWETTLRLIESGLRKIKDNPSLVLATKVDDILAAQAADRLAIIVGFQGASMIGGHFWRLNLLHSLGLRCLQLTYTAANLYGDGCGELRNAGLTHLGKEFIEAVNELDMMLDLSHCGHRTTCEAIELARAPVCTHSNAYGVNANDRNKRDEAIKALVEKGGMIGVTCLPRAVKLEDPTLEDLLDHVDYIAQLVGYEYVGIGLDFTEGYQERQVILPISRRWRTLRPDIFGSVDDFVKQSYPRGLHSIRLLPNFTEGLFDRGYTEDQAAAILGGNWLRTFRSAIG